MTRLMYSDKTKQTKELILNTIDQMCKHAVSKVSFGSIPLTLQERIAIFILLNIRTCITLFGTEKCKLTFGLKYI